MERNNGIKFLFFGIVVLVIAIGGFFLMQSTNPEKASNISKSQSKQKAKDIRLDKDKDYIYFEDDELIDSVQSIDYKKIYLNFEDTNKLADELNKETDELKKTVKYDEDEALEYAKYKKYEYFIYDDYVSLLINYYTYDSEKLMHFIDTKAYVFDKTTGNLLTSNDILRNFSLSKDDVSKKVKDYLEGQDLVKEEEELDVTATINALGDYALFVDKIGRLSISVLVKSSLNDYNDVIVLN